MERDTHSRSVRVVLRPRLILEFDEEVESVHATEVVADAMAAAGAGVPVLHSALTALEEAARGFSYQATDATREALMNELAATSEALGAFAALPEAPSPDDVVREAGL